MLVTVRRASWVENLGLKPNWMSESKLCLDKNLETWW